MLLGFRDDNIPLQLTFSYSKDPKSVTSFNELTFFHADINQSKAEDSFQLASDWIKSAQKSVNKSKVVALLGSLL